MLGPKLTASPLPKEVCLPYLWQKGQAATYGACRRTKAHDDLQAPPVSQVPDKNQRFIKQKGLPKTARI